MVSRQRTQGLRRQSVHIHVRPWLNRILFNILLFGGIMCAFVATSSVAGLTWDATSKNIEVHPLQASETIPFHFSNDGAGIIEILDLKPTCGCISGKIEEKVYQPGESGTLEVTFSLEKRVGPQRKGIEVKTSDSMTSTLYISANIKPSFKLSSKRLIWAADEERTLKSFVIINQHQASFRLKEAVPKSNGISVELVTKREGFEYELIVKPDPSLKNVLVPITIYPEMIEGVGEVKTFTAYVLLK